NCGRTSSAIRLRSLLESSSRILSANALLICSRAVMAEAVSASGRSRLVRTTRKSVPQARQNWLSWRSSEPQEGQYMAKDYTAGEKGSSDGLIALKARHKVARGKRVTKRSASPWIRLKDRRALRGGIGLIGNGSETVMLYVDPFRPGSHFGSDPWAAHSASLRACPRLPNA